MATPSFVVPTSPSGSQSKAAHYGTLVPAPPPRGRGESMQHMSLRARRPLGKGKDLGVGVEVLLEKSPGVSSAKHHQNGKGVAPEISAKGNADSNLIPCVAGPQKGGKSSYAKSSTVGLVSGPGKGNKGSAGGAKPGDLGAASQYAEQVAVVSETVGRAGSKGGGISIKGGSTTKGAMLKGGTTTSNTNEKDGRRVSTPNICSEDARQAALAYQCEIERYNADDVLDFKHADFRRGRDTKPQGVATTATTSGVDEPQSPTFAAQRIAELQLVKPKIPKDRTTVGEDIRDIVLSSAQEAHIVLPSTRYSASASGPPESPQDISPRPNADSSRPANSQQAGTWTRQGDADFVSSLRESPTKARSSILCVTVDRTLTSSTDARSPSRNVDVVPHNRNVIEETRIMRSMPVQDHDDIHADHIVDLHVGDRIDEDVSTVLNATSCTTPETVEVEAPRRRGRSGDGSGGQSKTRKRRKRNNRGHSGSSTSRSPETRQLLSTAQDSSTPRLLPQHDGSNSITNSISNNPNVEEQDPSSRTNLASCAEVSELFEFPSTKTPSVQGFARTLEGVEYIASPNSNTRPAPGGGIISYIPPRPGKGTSSTSRSSSKNRKAITRPPCLLLPEGPREKTDHAARFLLELARQYARDMAEAETAAPPPEGSAPSAVPQSSNNLDASSAAGDVRDQAEGEGGSGTAVVVTGEQDGGAESGGGADGPVPALNIPTTSGPSVITPEEAPSEAAAPEDAVAASGNATSSTSAAGADAPAPKTPTSSKNKSVMELDASPTSYMARADAERSGMIPQSGSKKASVSFRIPTPEQTPVSGPLIVQRAADMPRPADEPSLAKVVGKNVELFMGFLIDPVYGKKQARGNRIPLYRDWKNIKALSCVDKSLHIIISKHILVQRTAQLQKHRAGERDLRNELGKFWKDQWGRMQEVAEKNRELRLAGWEEEMKERVAEMLKEQGIRDSLQEGDEEQYGDEDYNMMGMEGSSVTFLTFLPPGPDDINTPVVMMDQRDHEQQIQKEAPKKSFYVDEEDTLDQRTSRLLYDLADTELVLDSRNYRSAAEDHNILAEDEVDPLLLEIERHVAHHELSKDEAMVAITEALGEHVGFVSDRMLAEEEQATYYKEKTGNEDLLGEEEWLDGHEGQREAGQDQGPSTLPDFLDIIAGEASEEREGQGTAAASHILNIELAGSRISMGPNESSNTSHDVSASAEDTRVVRLLIDLPSHHTPCAARDDEDDHTRQATKRAAIVVVARDGSISISFPSNHDQALHSHNQGRQDQQGEPSAARGSAVNAVRSQRRETSPGTSKNTTSRVYPTVLTEEEEFLATYDNEMIDALAPFAPSLHFPSSSASQQTDNARSIVKPISADEAQATLKAINTFNPDVMAASAKREIVNLKSAFAQFFTAWSKAAEIAPIVNQEDDFRKHVLAMSAVPKDWSVKDWAKQAVHAVTEKNDNDVE
ncbi:unnamed protein product [Amoebophrya sp. A25]|nr:unnamed protein product [Amoebophrya sp. A25]|eukprot:GSA25T00000493001.1